MVERFPFEAVGGGTRDQKERWFNALEAADILEVRAMLSPGTFGECLPLGDVQVKSTFAQAWLTWHDQRRQEAVQRDMVRAAMRSTGAAVVASAAAIASAAAAIASA